MSLIPVRAPLALLRIFSRAFSTPPGPTESVPSPKTMPATPGTPHPSSLDPVDPRSVPNEGDTQDASGKSEGGKVLEKKKEEEMEDRDLGDVQKAKERVVDTDQTSS